MAGVHYLAKCAFRGREVLHVVQGHLRSPDTLDIVFGKRTSLELATITEDGMLLSVFEQNIFGIIKDIAILSRNDEFLEPVNQGKGNDILLVLSDSGKLSFLDFHSEMHRFFARTHIDLSKPEILRYLSYHLRRRLAADPRGCFVAVSLNEDQVTVFSVSISFDRNVVYEKISFPAESKPEASIRQDEFGAISLDAIVVTMCFISNGTYSTEGYEPILAILVNRSGRNHLMLFACNPYTQAIQVVSEYSEDGPLARDVCSVPHLPGFAIVFRNGDMLLMDLRDRHNFWSYHKINLDGSMEYRSHRDEASSSKLIDVVDVVDDDDELIDENEDAWNIEASVKSMPYDKFICSWTWEPSNPNSRLIICCDTGGLYIVEIYPHTEGIRVNLSKCLFSGWRCKALSWVNAGLIACLVDNDDGYVLKLEHDGLIYKTCIRNFAPIMDISVADYFDEKQDRIFAACGMKEVGSLRTIQSGINVRKLFKSDPIYQGVTGMWTLKMKKSDTYHSFLVLSFVEETRVLSVGSTFSDVIDAVGFQSDVCTLACGLFADGMLVQIYRNGVKLCLPTAYSHSDGASFSLPKFSYWSPSNMTVSVGAVGENVIIVATSNPRFLYILGVELLSTSYEVQEIGHTRLQDEVSCISIPIRNSDCKQLARLTNVDPDKCDVNMSFVIGTYKPSVEVLSYAYKGAFSVIAAGNIEVRNALGNPVWGCIPEDVRLVSVDHLYILVGLRNGMLLRFEWPATNSLPVLLQLISLRFIGITPAVLVPLKDSLDADIIVLSDRPWLLNAARHCLVYTSILFQHATHVTPVFFVNGPKGILFVAEDSLHLVEMVHCSPQKFSINGSPLKHLYHSESKTLFVLRVKLINESSSYEICRIDPRKGTLISKFKCKHGETAHCMLIMKVGKEQVLVVGTSQQPGYGELDRIEGRLIVLSLDSTQSFSERSPVISLGSHCSSQIDPCDDEIYLDEIGAGMLRVIIQIGMDSAVTSVCPYLGQYVLAAAGKTLYVFGFLNDNPKRPKKLTSRRTPSNIGCLSTYFNRIAVGVSANGIYFYSYHEDVKKLELLYSYPYPRMFVACALMDRDTAVVSDRVDCISVLSCPNTLEANEYPARKLVLNCSFYMGETVRRIQKAPISCKRPINNLSCSDGVEIVEESSHNSVVAGTLDGSVFILIPVTSEQHALLEAVQSRLAVHHLTSPVLGNDHKEYRGRGLPPGAPGILDGDMLMQFLKLTTLQQEDVLGLRGLGANALDVDHRPITVNQVIHLLEHFHFETI